MCYAKEYQNIENLVGDESACFRSSTVHMPTLLVIQMRKNKYIEIQNVFLDASIFEEQNFKNSTKIHSLVFYAQNGAIQIHTTTFSKKELHCRIEKRIIESKSEFKKLTNTFNHKNARLVKNIGFYKSVSIPEINVKNHTAELIKKMDNFFSRSNVNISYEE